MQRGVQNYINIHSILYSVMLHSLKLPQHRMFVTVTAESNKW